MPSYFLGQYHSDRQPCTRGKLVLRAVDALADSMQISVDGQGVYRVLLRPSAYGQAVGGAWFRTHKAARSFCAVVADVINRKRREVRRAP